MDLSQWAAKVENASSSFNARAGLAQSLLVSRYLSHSCVVRLESDERFDDFCVIETNVSADRTLLCNLGVQL